MRFLSLSETPKLPIPTTNLIAWWKFDVGIIKNGSRVARWDAEYGDFYWEQTSMAKQPTYTSGELVFDGVDDEMSLGSEGLSIVRNKTGVALYIVMRSRISQTKYIFWTAEGVGPTSYRYATRTLALEIQQLQRRVDGGSGFGLDYSSGSYTADTDFLSSSFVDYTGNDAKLYLNQTEKADGAAGSTGTTSDTDSLNAYLGSSNGGNYLDGGIKEIILVEGPNYRTEYESYLMTEHGL